MPRYIDIHTHILPGLDDGPADMEAALKLGRTLVEQGFHTVVATPHCREGQPSPAVIRDCLQELRRALAAEQIRCWSCPGGAGRGTDLVRRLRGKRPDLNGGRYVLVELPFCSRCRRLSRTCSLSCVSRLPAGPGPPERVREFQSDQPRCTAWSAPEPTPNYPGLPDRTPGPPCETVRERMLRARLVHFVATDAHGSDGRLSIAAYRSLLSDWPAASRQKKSWKRTPLCCSATGRSGCPKRTVAKRKKKSYLGNLTGNIYLITGNFDLFGE